MKPFTKYEKLGAYHWKWYEQNKYNYKDHVNKVIKYFKGCSGSILDIGCGDALIASKLCDIGLKVYGIDPNKKAIELGADKCKSYIDTNQLILKNMSIFDLNKSRKFDYVLCNEVIEHITEPLRCIKRIDVFSQKFAIITTPNSKYHTIGEYDYNMWNPDTIVKELFYGLEDRVQFLKKGSDLHIKLKGK